MAIIGQLIRNDVPILKGGHPTDNWYSPLILISLYSILRYAYKKKYKVEPTYDHSWRFDFDDNREINGFDIVVHLVPFLLALIIPLFF